MKITLKTCIFLAVLISYSTSLSGKKVKQPEWLQTALIRSEQQIVLAAETYKSKNLIPRTSQDEQVLFVGIRDWTSGFFAGSLWYLYEYTKNETIKKHAQYYTQLIELAKYRRDTHDLGFILNCSFGNGYRLTGDETYKDVLVTGAASLMTRYNPNVGLIKSWDTRKRWNYAVIIDNLMNLEFLFNVAKMVDDPEMSKVCISHADKTILNHFRSDNSSFHVVNYDSITGAVVEKVTHQGYNDESAWSRGQAWGLYGYTIMYRETRDPKYLNQAVKIAEFILNHPRLPEDLVPYWDFDAPRIPNEPRDASAAAITASALIELSTYVKSKNNYFKKAESILKTLSSDSYFANPGENGLFILRQSTGHLPKNSEVNVPLNYADYYYLEALGRYMKLKGIKLCNY
jgi:unsaturated chondroitin disaccharide hydrolase